VTGSQDELAMNLADFAKDISNTVLAPIPQDESQIDMATFVYASPLND
jgi:hypothetical protein